MVKYDPFLNLSTAIVEVLQQYSSAKPKEIRKHLEEIGWGKPPINAVNKVLTQYFDGQVSRDKDGRWILSEENVSPVAGTKRKSVKKNSNVP
jgi:hypothetical protein